MKQMFFFNFGFDSGLEPNSDPNQSRDSFIFIKLNTLSTGEVFVSLKGK